MNKITYSLALFKQPEFKIIQNLSQCEFEKHSEYIEKLISLRNDENLFKIVELNFADFISKIASTTKEFSQGIIETSGEQFLYLEINRLLLNLLSSIRTYLDHTETLFKREYGSDSNEYVLFKTETSKAYDENFAYRFLYKLRNYSQHCSLPAGSIKSHEFYEDEIEKYVLELSFSRDDLLRNFEWGKPITEELKKQEELFDIIFLVQAKFDLLEIINKKAKYLSYNHFKRQGYELLELLQKIEDKDGVPCILETTKVSANQTQLSVHWFPFDGIAKTTGVQLY